MLGITSSLTAQNYDFSYTYQGKTLLYKVTDNEQRTVSVVPPQSGGSNGWISGQVTIPDSVEYNGVTYSVTSIGNWSFWSCKSLVSVSIPSTVISIGNNAFSYSGITEFPMGESVVTIGGGAYAGCSGLTSAEIGDSVVSIGNGAFESCNNITSITMSNSVSHLGERAFMDCLFLESVTLSNSITELPEYVFCRCEFLENVNIPDSLISIGPSAFYSCFRLDSVNLPNTVITIAGYAFYHSGLKSITIPASVSSIGTSAFSSSTLTTISVAEENPYYDSRDNCNAIIWTALNQLIQASSSTVIPNTVTSIASQAFSNIQIHSNLVIPESITSIGQSAFYNCGILSITIPNSVVSIESSAFRESSLRTITFESSVTSIGTEAFYNCPLDTVFFLGTTPPTLGSDGSSFRFCYNVAFLVPCGSADVYRSASGWNGIIDSYWPTYASRVQDWNYWEHECSFASNNLEYGTVSYVRIDCDSNLTVTAMPNVGFQLVGWSDGGSGNPRTFHLTGDTAVTAIFDYIPYAITGGTQSLMVDADFENEVYDTLWTIDNSSHSYYEYRNSWNINTLDDTNRALFISSDSGQHNWYAYSTSDWWTTMVCTYTTMYLQAGNYGFGYDWRCEGELNFDYLRAVIIPDTCSHHDIFISYSTAAADEVIPMDGGSQLSRSATWQSISDTLTVPTSGFYKILFRWRNDNSTGGGYAAAVDNIYFYYIGGDDASGVVYGSDTVHYNDTVTLAAVPNPGYHFVMWDDRCTDNPRTVTAIGNHHYVAIMVRDRHFVAANVDDETHGTISGFGVYKYLDSCKLSATPNYGYHFTQWSDGDTTNPRTIVLTQDTTFTALFERNSYSIAALTTDSIKGAATVSDSRPLYLDSVTLTATASYGYHFAQWNDGNTDNPRAIEASRDSVFTAMFENNSYDVIVSVNDSVMGTAIEWPDSPVYLDSVTLAATASYGYHFMQWNDGSTDNPRTIVLTQDTAFTALFDKNIYGVGGVSEDSIMGFVTGSDSIAYLDTVTLTATPNYGYHFAQWSDGNTDNPRTVQVTRDSVFTAQFEKNQYTIALNVDSESKGEAVMSALRPNNMAFTMIEFSFGDNDVVQWAIYRTDSVLVADTDDYWWFEDTLAIDEGRQCRNVLFREYITSHWVQIDTSYSMIDEADYGTIRIQQMLDDAFGGQYRLPDGGFYNFGNSVIYSWDSIIVFRRYVLYEEMLPSFDVSEDTVDYLDSVTFWATPHYGYHFAQWNDGDTNNPRTITLTQDTTFTAMFANNSYSVTALADSTRGTATVSNSLPLYLDSVTLTATPNYGYHFARWNDGDTSNPRTAQVACDSVFTALFGYNQYNIVLSVDTYYHGTVSGAGVFNYLSEQTITALPSYGYHFTAWNDGDSTNPRIVTLTQDTTLTAMFDRNSYHLTAFSADTVMGAATAIDSTLFYLDIITIAATANYGYHFSQWSDGITENPRAVLVTRDSILSAVFAKSSYSVTVTSADTIMGSTGKTPENHVYLDSVTLTAYPAYGCHFTQWNDGDSANPRVIMLTQDTAFVASFGFNQYTVTVQSNDTTLGSVTGNGNTVYYHDSIAISATCTAPHHHFVQWSDGCTETPRMITVTCDTLFTAIFAIDTHVVAYGANDSTMGVVEGATEAPYGSTVTLTATAEEGYHFGAWSNGAMENPYTLTVVNDTAVTAYFTADLSPELCMVGVSDWKNQLIWEPLEAPCTAYRLYRESDMAGVYELIAEVPYDSATTFVDSTSRPMTRSYRYRISGVDPYGREGVQSPEHKTMHLTISQGIGNHWNLVWTEYEGAEYSTYIIYRGTSQNDLQQIDVMPAGGNTTYTDAEAPAGDVYYQVGVMMTTPCNPTKAATISLSNIATNGVVGIAEAEAEAVRVYVEENLVVVRLDDAGERSASEAIMFDIMGRRIASAKLVQGEARMAAPADGVFLVKIGDYAARRVVVIR